MSAISPSFILDLYGRPCLSRDFESPFHRFTSDFVIVEVNLLLSEYLISLVALAGYQHHVSFSSLVYRMKNGFASIRKLYVRARILREAATTIL